MKQSKPTNHLFVALPVIQKYGISASWVFAHVAYFIAKYGNYNTNKQWTSAANRRTTVGKTTFRGYLKKFVDDGLLIEADGLYIFDERNMVFEEDVVAAYCNTFSNGAKQITTVSLIEVNPHKCDPKNMIGTKAKHERIVKTVEAWSRDRSASNFVFEQKEGFKAKSYAYLGRLFNIDWRTVKAVLSTIQKVKRSFHIMRDKVTNQLTLIRTALPDRLYGKKVKKFSKKLELQKQKLSQRFRTVLT
jgi:hypothetical protein